MANLRKMHIHRADPIRVPGEEGQDLVQTLCPGTTRPTRWCRSRRFGTGERWGTARSPSAATAYGSWRARTRSCGVVK